MARLAASVLLPFLALYYEQIGLTGAQIRLWGSIGWGIGAPLIGPLVARFGLN